MPVVITGTTGQIDQQIVRTSAFLVAMTNC